MNILLATLYSFPQPGGLGSYMRELTRELEQRGHSVEILACHPSFRGYYTLYGQKWVETASVRDQQFYRDYPELTANGSPMNAWMKERELERLTFAGAARALDLSGYDLVHTQDIVSTCVLTTLTNGRTPVVQTLHDSTTHHLALEHGASISGTDIWEYAARMERAAVASSAATIVPSRWLKETLIHNSGVCTEKLHVIPNGINVNRFLLDMEQDASIPKPQQTVITCVGHLTELKGQRYLLRALSKLEKRHSEWVCWIIGNGPDQARLEHMSKALGLGQTVQFLGERADVPALLRETDVFVLPSLTENCPYSVLEAQVAGVPVVASNTGGIPEIVQHGFTGWLVPPRDANALYIALAHLLDDPEFMKQIRENCVRLCRQEWSSSNMTARILAVYENTWAKGKGRS